MVATLNEVFERRISRASSALKNPDAGPKKIMFCSDDLSSVEKLDSLHKKFPKGNSNTIYLYQLSLIESEELSIAQVRAAFRNGRDSASCSMSRDNKDHADTCSLYVGTSEDLYGRFRTHLGRGRGKSTWALYLSLWASQLSARFLLEYYEFTEAAKEDIELIEGVLWDSLHPLFGKKGGK